MVAGELAEWSQESWQDGRRRVDRSVAGRRRVDRMVAGVLAGWSQVS
jgi:hypothetical protein